MATKTLKCDIDIDSETEDVSLTMSSEQIYPLPHVDDSSGNVFDKGVDALNVVDIYNIASSVGQEFERLTDAFGGAVFSGVMPKIIRILEMLEALVTKKEEEVDQITELNASLQKLQLDSKQKDNKQQEEIDIIESVWKDETKDLMETVAMLEEDNQKLTAMLTDKLQEESEVKILPEQTILVTKLREQIAKQRDEIRAKNSLIEEQTRESEALQLQVQRLTKLNVDIRNKAYILEQQGKALIEQKMDLEAKMNEEQKHNLAEIQLRSLQKTQNTKDLSNKRHDDESTTELDHPSIVDPLLANKLVIDLSDPNRPRYTRKELQEVLNDRNQLKARCFLLEEELIFYRGEETWEELNDSEINESKNYIPREQSKPAESGIRRFFNYLTGDGYRRKNTATRSPVKRAVSLSDQKHNVVDEIDQKNLINPSDLKELVSNTCLEVNVVTETGESPSSEMRVMSPLEERDDLSP